MPNSRTDKSSTGFQNDLFSAMWGATTRWKLGRVGQRLETDQFDPMRASQNLLPVVKAPSPSLDLNKPLPEIPSKAQTRPNLSYSATNRFSISSYGCTSASISSGSSDPLFLGKKRKSIFSFGRTKKQKSSPLPQQPILLDKGTQTDEWLLEQFEVSSLGQTPGSSHRLWRKRLATSESSTPTVIKGPQWPVRGPHGHSESSEYFSFPWSRTLGPSSVKKTPSSDSEEQPPVVSKQKPFLPAKNFEFDLSRDSIGTYESRYSSEPVLEPIFKPKLSLLRNAASDTSVVTISKNRPGTPEHPPSPLSNPRPPNPLPLEASSSESLTYKRPNLPRLASSYARLASPSFRGHHKSKTSSDTLESHHSPRHEPRKRFHHEELKTSTRSEGVVQFQRSPTDLFRKEIPFDDDADSVLEQSAYAAVPDHLRSSPLCPMHPKHKSGGLGTCPVHGRRRTVTDSVVARAVEKIVPETLDEIKATSSTLSVIATPHYEAIVTGKRASLPTGLTEAEIFKFKPEEHSADSPSCPANQLDGKGICVYHGRNASLAG